MARFIELTQHADTINGFLDRKVETYEEAVEAALKYSLENLI